MTDRPIRFARDDVLDRSGLVHSIVRTIERAPLDGYVIAIHGAWGEGKTSILNLVTEILRSNEIAQVVPFNPWMFSESEQLVGRFFNELAAEINLRGGKTGERVADALLRYASLAQPLGYLPTTGRIFNLSAVAARGGAAMLRAGTSLSERRREISEQLQALERPIVVVLDDVDRLTPLEIRELMRLVRLIADLPNLIYLLAFERSTVTRVLGDGDERLGDAYLEKIVQVAFDLPAIKLDRLERVLRRELEDTVDLDEHFYRPERMERLADAGLFHLLRNLRDVRRLMSSVPALIEFLEDEIELSDLLALECLRLVEPELSAAIPNCIEALTTITSNSRRPYGGHLAPEEQEEVWDQLLRKARKPSLAEPVLRELFPAVLEGGQDNVEGTADDELQDLEIYALWSRERRVADGYVLGIYVDRSRLDRLPVSTVASAVVALANPEELSALLRPLRGDHLEQCLIRMSYSDIPENSDIAGSFQVIVSAMKRRSWRIRLTRMVGSAAMLLRKMLSEMDSEKMEQLLSGTVYGDVSIRLLIFAALAESTDRTPRLDESATARIELHIALLCLELSADQMRREEEFSALLWLAMKHQPAALKSRLDLLLDDPDFVLFFLDSCVYERPRGVPGYRYILRWDKLAEYAGNEKLAQSVLNLDKSLLSEPDRGPLVRTAKALDELTGRRGGLQAEIARQAKHYATHAEAAAVDWDTFCNPDITFEPSYLRQT